MCENKADDEDLHVQRQPADHRVRLAMSVTALMTPRLQPGKGDVIASVCLGNRQSGISGTLTMRIIFFPPCMLHESERIPVLIYPCRTYSESASASN